MTEWLTAMLRPRSSAVPALSSRATNDLQQLEPGSKALYSEQGWNVVVTVLDDQSNEARESYLLRVEKVHQTSGWPGPFKAGHVFLAERDRRYAYAFMWSLDTHWES